MVPQNQEKMARLQGTRLIKLNILDELNYTERTEYTEENWIC